MTWLLPSGRKNLTVPFLRTSASRSASWCASMMGSGHQLGGLVAGVAEHHALIAGALFVVRVDAVAVHALRDVG